MRGGRQGRDAGRSSFPRRAGYTARRDRYVTSYTQHTRGSSSCTRVQTSIDVESMGRRDGGEGLVQDQRGLQWLRIRSDRVEMRHRENQLSNESGCTTPELPNKSDSWPSQFQSRIIRHIIAFLNLVALHIRYCSSATVVLASSGISIKK